MDVKLLDSLVFKTESKSIFGFQHNPSGNRSVVAYCEVITVCCLIATRHLVLVDCCCVNVQCTRSTVDSSSALTDSVLLL